MRHSLGVAATVCSELVVCNAGACCLYSPARQPHLPVRAAGTSGDAVVKARGKHYQLACAIAFEGITGTPHDSGINRPSDYYAASAEAAAPKKDQQLGRGGGGGGGDGDGGRSGPEASGATPAMPARGGGGPPATPATPTTGGAGFAVSCGGSLSAATPASGVRKL